MQKVKKGFLQACLNHGCINHEKINQILEPLCDAYEVEKPENIKELVTEINKELHGFNHALTFVKHPLVGNEEFLVYGSTFETQACKHQQHFSDADRYYFAKLLERMVNNEDYNIPWMEIYSVLNDIPTQQKQLTKNRVQDIVGLWTKQGYFLEKDDILYFGPRMMVEYASYLKIHFPELMKDCALCGKLVFWDVKCSNCDAKVHRDCIRQYLIKNSNCPACKSTWNTRLSSA